MLNTDITALQVRVHTCRPRGTVLRRAGAWVLSLAAAVTTVLAVSARAAAPADLGWDAPAARAAAPADLGWDAPAARAAAPADLGWDAPPPLAPTPFTAA
ncbi:hypothetical protein [Streptomyces sp. NPDC088923]|uniref:hypothetical protein n=1 Tax=Streptomyces sp. NPDC088923 TaxID=3365913 RepID=UPI0037F9EE44